MNLLERVRQRDPRAVAQVITRIEVGDLEARTLVAALQQEAHQCLVVGVTGPPGAGKSTLIAALVRYWRHQHRRVGILAIDPTSARTGGAVLGDRLRLVDHVTDPDVFWRSMATRGRPGGIASATAGAVLVLAAAGFDVICIETVGVGQLESAVRPLVDVLLLVQTPGVGDDVQLLKAGLLELVDAVVVMRGASPDAAATARRLERELHAPHPVPVFVVEATTGKGVGTVAQRVDDLASREESDTAWRGSDIATLTASLLADVSSIVCRRLQTSGVASRLAAEVAAGRLTREEAVRGMVAEFGILLDM